MLKKNRVDGTFLKIRGLDRLMPFFMKKRSESLIFFEQEIDVSKAFTYIKEKNAAMPAGKRKHTFFQLYIAALVRTIALRPRLNRFVMNKRYYQRNQMTVSFIIKKTLSDHGDEVNMVVPFSPYDTFDTVSDKVLAAVQEAKSEAASTVNERDVRIFSALPNWMIGIVFWGINFLDRHNLIPKAAVNNLPFYSSVFLTNVGSINIDAPFHHNYEMGTTSFLIAIGKFKKQNYIDDDGSVKTRHYVTVRYTHDDKVADGVYCARALNLIKHYVENPEKLDVAPQITEELLEELKLKDFPPAKKKK
ncbi:MAG: 2-oxo acid dehydrogenase subunit E2 [Spirochaetales bacterium]|nr:2-oxo acid dehydrogenase subunit E2 [Spirochaetales bacterium]